MIRRILEDQTNNDLKRPRNIILHYVSNCGKELLSKEIRSNTQVD